MILTNYDINLVRHVGTFRWSQLQLWDHYITQNQFITTPEDLHKSLQGFTNVFKLSGEVYDQSEHFLLSSHLTPHDFDTLYLISSYLLNRELLMEHLGYSNIPNLVSITKLEVANWGSNKGVAPFSFVPDFDKKVEELLEGFPVLLEFYYSFPEILPRIWVLDGVFNPQNLEIKRELLRFYQIYKDFPTRLFFRKHARNNWTRRGIFQESTRGTVLRQWVSFPETAVLGDLPDSVISTLSTYGMCGLVTEGDELMKQYNISAYINEIKFPWDFELGDNLEGVRSQWLPYNVIPQ